MSVKNTIEINQAVKILNQGGIIIFPTDTAFGIGCRIDKPNSIKKLFRLRKRPSEMAVPVLVASIAMAEKYLLSPLPDNVRRIMQDYWPGGLTIIYKCQISRVTPLVRGNGNTLGVRMPNYDKILEIIKRAGVPILGTSANFHSDATPYRLEDLNKDLVRQVDFVVGGVCKLKQASTVIDTTVSPWKILRQGKTIININKY